MKTALITGGAQRIGKEISLFLAKEGYDIALHYHSSYASAQKTAAAIRKIGRHCEIFDCDLNDETAVLQLISRAQKNFNSIDVLINSASIFEKSTIISGTLEDFNRHWNINLKAPYILIREFARHCRQGHIINMLDTNIVQNKITHVAYLLSKKALAQLTTLAAVELSPNIRVNGIAPGLILPPEQEKMSYLERLAKNIPLKRKGKIENVLSTISFLNHNDFLTGQIIYVDGGEHLT